MSEVLGATITPPTPREADDAASAEYAALVADVRDMPPELTGLPTDCAGWSVHDVVAHVTEAAREGAHPMLMMSRYARSGLRSRGRPLVDGVNDLQVERGRRRSWPDLLTDLEDLAPQAVHGRRRTPPFVRNRRLPASQGLPAGATIGYVSDVVHTRDVWMHRVDLERATGRPMSASPAETAIVTQVVRDLARAWDGPSILLHLTGRVTGSWVIGDPASRLPTAVADAVDLCRRLSGRAGEREVDGPPVATAALLRAVVVF